MTRLIESLRFALRGVVTNKMRSALTTLGMLIGVSAVIILVAVGTGSQAAVQASISRLGSNTLTVNPIAAGTGGRGGNAAALAALFGIRGGAAGPSTSTGTQIRPAQLTVEDARALTDATTAPDVLGVAPLVTVRSAVATHDGASHPVATFLGTTEAYLGINNETVAAGRAFTDDDYLQHNRVALLGLTVATDLAGGNANSIVGQSVQFNGIAFQVVGLLGTKGSTGLQDQDDRVLAPLTAVQDTLTGYGPLSSISVKAASAETVPAAQAEVQSVLDTRHSVNLLSRDYSVFSAASLIAAATSSTKTLTVLLAAVAAISLLVGGIGVMNIMLVTVTERTREIGIRKAIGAGRADIVGQFLTEALILSFLGGLAGVAIGLIGARFSIVGVQPVVAPYSVFLAFGTSLLIGVVFGLYPANRAAVMRPIDALRYE